MTGREARGGAAGEGRAEASGLGRCSPREQMEQGAATAGEGRAEASGLARCSLREQMEQGAATAGEGQGKGGLRPRDSGAALHGRRRSTGRAVRKASPYLTDFHRAEEEDPGLCSDGKVLKSGQVQVRYD